MSNIEQIIYNDIITMIKNNLQLLIYNRDSCLYRFNKYCKDMYEIKLKEYVIFYFLLLF